jgi:hypothetical protein
LPQQLGGGGDTPVPVPDVNWPDPGTLIGEICIVPDPKNPTGPCPSADDMANGSLTIAPAPASNSSGTMLLRLTPTGTRALQAGKPFKVLARLSIRFGVGPSGTTSQVLTITPQAPSPAAAISSVTVSGTTQNPSIVVKGTNLGSKPAPNPSVSPSNQRLCPVVIKGNVGLDYGTSLYLNDNTGNFSAGRYRPTLNELDCIGLIVTKFTPTEIDLRPGNGYQQFLPKYQLNDGDAVEIAVNGTSKTVHVKYGTAVSN